MPKSKRFKTKRDDAAKNYQEKIMRILHEKQERAIRKRKTM